MNKKRVNEWIPRAKDALIKAGITNGNKLDSAFRGQISSFGAAIITGSLTAAVAFFSQQGNASVSRQNLLRAVDYVVNSERTDCRSAVDVFETVCNANETLRRQLTEQYIDAAIALKLAMNFFDMGKKDGEDDENT